MFSASHSLYACCVRVDAACSGSSTRGLTYGVALDDWVCGLRADASGRLVLRCQVSIR
jgi:hypothetical protein